MNIVYISVKHISNLLCITSILDVYDLNLFTAMSRERMITPE